MKLRIIIQTDNTGETLVYEKVDISTNPDHIRLAKAVAEEAVEHAVDLLIERAVAPLECNELREVIL